MQYYQIFCNLSLDVIFGIWCCMLPLPEIFHLSISPTWYILLPLSAWIVYLTDHLIDVKRKKNLYPTPRHRFIKKYFKQIIYLIILVAGVGIFIIIDNFDKTTFFAGIIICAVVLLHFILVGINPQRKIFINNKEFAIAFIYTTGIYAVPLKVIFLQRTEFITLFLCYVLFLLVVFLNLLLASIIEYEYDVKMENSSFVKVVSPELSQTIFNALSMIAVISAGLLILQERTEVGYLLICYQFMTVGHYLIYLYRGKLSNYLAYRKLAEILFWLPGIVYLLVK